MSNPSRVRRWAAPAIFFPCQSGSNCSWPAKHCPGPPLCEQGARGADVGDELLVPRTIEHDDHQVVDIAIEALGDGVQVVLDARVEMHRVFAARTDDEL